MANAQASHSVGTRYWSVPIVRAALAFVPAAAITFNANHSAQFGLVVFGAFALVSGVAVGLLSRRTLTDARERSLFLLQGVVGMAAGALALAFNAGGLGFFLYLVTVWAAVTGFLELYSGIRARRRDPGDRDWLVVGAFTAVLALVFLLLPPNPVVSVGLLGAYLVMLGVYLVIAGLSLKWASTPDPRTLTASPNDSDTL
ncbi:hypothetical protein E3T26_15505 [Cryobacterium sp. TMT1-21]|uniref:DUF308 domain-containing protein n=1 Tax=Cryobacterium shii TaxID=1259235 RepID=A0AAQ2C3I8_9MICO|nr:MULTISPECIES: DUF308 domain-containing protein [Cryobacterium]TFC41823.1 hypothetical protein E3O49_15715 [Cryobacterium shii]TFC88078.1 hypothetical protein E3T24_03795 [Cryobacterium sp. TmT2-59]TFD08620.1 hypothetical protein E3T26_15505 [Cryobacterium sp. TMT1-21]TFD14815.1 hypothetical protein E3T42_11275 [Cryobacterium sp. TMT4-10]TFD20025.1 hypothetical protein E3T32_09580 [Cryobacterium sp. TMT2-23]